MTSRSIDLAARAANQNYYDATEKAWTNERKAKWASNQEKRYNNRFKPFHNHTRKQYEDSYLRQKRFQFRTATNRIKSYQQKRNTRLTAYKTTMRQLNNERTRRALPAWRRVLQNRAHYYQTPRQNYIYKEVMEISRLEAQKMDEIQEITSLARQGLL